MRRYVDGALARPRVEDRADRLRELLARLLREVLAGRLLEELARTPPCSARSCVDVELGVELDAGALLGGRDLGLEALAGDAAHDVAEHLHEAPVGVPREALVAGARGEALDRVVVEPEVEDRVEHAGHRLARARAHGDEQRVVGVAELLAGGRLEARERLVDLRRRVPSGSSRPALHVGDARLGRDREARRDAVGAEDPRHLGDVRALAAEQVAHLARALGEVVDPLHLDRARLPRRAILSAERPVAVERARDARASRRSRGRPGAARARSALGASASGEPSAPVRNVVRLLAEREARRLAGAADDAAGGARERGEVVGLAARRAGGELRREAGGEQELEAKRELVGVRARMRRPRVEQRELVAEEREHAGMRLGRLEQARHRVARAGRADRAPRRARAGADGR